MPVELDSLRQRVAELEARGAEAETMYAVLQSLSTTLNLNEVIETILVELEKVVPYDSCSVQQIQGNNFVIVGGRGFANMPELLGLRFDPSGRDDPGNEVVRTRSPYIVEDVSARYAHFRNRVHGKGQIHGWMGVPLLFENRLIGMLTLDKFETGFYTERHARLAMAFAAQAATAIENARRFEETRQAKETADVLRAANVALTQNLKLEMIFDTLLEYLCRLIPYDCVSIFLIEDGGVLAQPLHHFQHIMAAHRVKRRRRLIQDQQVGVIDLRLGDAETLALAAGETFDRAVGPIFKADQP